MEGNNGSIMKDDGSVFLTVSKEYFLVDAFLCQYKGHISWNKNPYNKEKKCIPEEYIDLDFVSALVYYRNGLKVMWGISGEMPINKPYPQMTANNLLELIQKQYPKWKALFDTHVNVNHEETNKPIAIIPGYPNMFHVVLQITSGMERAECILKQLSRFDEEFFGIHSS